MQLCDSVIMPVSGAVVKDTTTMPTQCPCTPTKVAGAPVSKFTVSYATQTFHPHTYVRTDMEEQLAAVKAHEAQRRAARMQHIERESTISEMNRRVGVKLLLRSAAQRDMALGQCTGYDNGVQKFMWQTWNAFLAQANEFLSAEGADVAVDGTPAMCSRAALENASSIGLWFNGPCLSLPLRRYAVQVENSEGQLESVVFFGLVSFSYSSYIMQLRMGAQTIILDEMQRMNTQLETACLFSPQLLIAAGEHEDM